MDSELNDKRFNCKLYLEKDCEGYYETYCNCDGSGCGMCRKGQRFETCENCEDYIKEEEK